MHARSSYTAYTSKVRSLSNSLLPPRTQFPQKHTLCPRVNGNSHMRSSAMVAAATGKQGKRPHPSLLWPPIGGSKWRPYRHWDAYSAPTVRRLFPHCKIVAFLPLSECEPVFFAFSSSISPSLRFQDPAVITSFVVSRHRTQLLAATLENALWQVLAVAACTKLWLAVVRVLATGSKIVVVTCFLKVRRRLRYLLHHCG